MLAESESKIVKFRRWYFFAVVYLGHRRCCGKVLCEKYVNDEFVIIHRENFGCKLLSVSNGKSDVVTVSVD